MSQRQSVLNTFQDGMVTDVDVQRQRNSSYRYSLNGRVVYNEDGTLSWEVAKGTIGAFSVPVGYTAIGFCEINSKLVVFSLKAVNPATTGDSEIGIVTEDQYGTYVYTTFINDTLLTDKLNFDIRYPIEAAGIVETENIERVYFGDDYNEDRVINILMNPADITVHGMSEMPDLKWGLMKFVENIKGNLTTGKRQYCYQYIHKTGYESPWSPLTEKIFITSEQVNNEDWNRYYLETSGVATTKGHRFELKMLDTRFESVRVACILWENEKTAKEASIIYEGKIDPSGVMTINHTDNRGQIILIEQLNQRYFETQHSKTRLIKEQNLHKANVFFREIVKFNTEDVTAVPFLRRMLSDEKQAEKNGPISHQSPKVTSVNVNLFDGHTEEYKIDSSVTTQPGDYINYKGTQWDMLFKGYWRGSVVPFSIVFWNRKGQPEFALPLFDFKFPEQYGNQFEIKRTNSTITGTAGNVGDYCLTNFTPSSTYQITDGAYGTPVVQGNNIVLNLLGIKFNNIDLTDILYGDDGKLQLSGFSIVRTDRVPDILLQGVMMNAIQPFEFTPEIPPLPGIAGPQTTIPTARPQQSPGNGYTDIKTTFSGRDYYTYSPVVPSRILQMGLLWNYPIPSTIPQLYVTRVPYAIANVHNFEAPDFMINPALIDEQNTHYVKVVGNVQAAFLSSAPVQLSGDHGHFYTKNYHTYMDDIYWYNDQADLTPTDLYEYFTHWGYEKQVTEMVLPKFKISKDEVAIDNGYYFLEASPILNNYYIPLSSNTIEFRSYQHHNAIWMKNGIKNISCRITPWSNDYNEENCAYFLVNYRTGLADYIIDDNLLATRQYQSIGHFVPINETTIAEATDEEGKVIFNGVEVWGGDCYLDYFAYCRLLPQYTTECKDPTEDYAIGLSFPFESNYNHTMRFGIQYAKDGSMPQTTVCSDDNFTDYEVWGNGVFTIEGVDGASRKEDFNINAVFTPTPAASNAKVFGTEPLGYVENRNFPLIEMVSDSKILGERFDNFRKFRINNFQYADGKHNAIVKLEQLGQNIYVIQQNGLSLLRYNQREFVTVESGTIATGSAQGYGGHDFISNIGSQHQWSVVNSGRGIYGVDAEKGKHWRFGADGMNMLSDIYGQHNYFTKKTRDFWKRPTSTWDDNENFFDRPLYDGGIHSVWDPKNGSVYVTFVNRTGTNDETIEYSEAANHYKSFHSFTPGLYAKYKMSFLSQGNDARLWRHDEGTLASIYGSFVKPRLDFIVNPAFPYTVVFDNAKLNVNPGGQDGFASLVMTTDTDTQGIFFPADTRWSYRDSRLVFPLMGYKQTSRLRGEYVSLSYEFNNITSSVLRISSQETNYRLSHRM